MNRLTLQAPGPYSAMSAGRTAAAGLLGVCGPSSKPGGGKSGLHGDTVAANGRRGRPQGKCHRKQTAFGSPEVRVKGCGKSAPRGRRRSWQGKPHREQDQIGVAGRARKRGARSVIRPATRVGCLRRPAMGAPDEWPSRRNFGQHSASRCWAILQTEPGLQASWQLHFSKRPRAICKATQSRLWRRGSRGRRCRLRRSHGCRGRRCHRFGSCSRLGRRSHRWGVHAIPNDAQHCEHGYGNEKGSLIHNFFFLRDSAQSQ